MTMDSRTAAVAEALMSHAFPSGHPGTKDDRSKQDLEQRREGIAEDAMVAVAALEAWDREHAEAGSVLVSPWTVLMAVRYGMGRLTYANVDAARLARQHWDVLTESAHRTIRSDAQRLQGSVREPWMWLLSQEPEPGAATGSASH